MKKSTRNIIMLILLTITLLVSSIIFANSKSIILKESDKYLIYNEKTVDEEFIFAISKENKKEDLIFYTSAKDTNNEDAKNVAYIDGTTEGYLDENLEAFLYIKDKEGNYIVDGEKISLKNAIDKQIVETTTKRISVDTTKNNKTTTNIDGVQTEVTKGKVVITDNENAKYSYILIKLPTNEENNYSKLMKLAKEISNKEELEKLDFMKKLELMNSFYLLYKNVEPQVNDTAWIKVQDLQILQPEDSKNGEEYIVFIKSVNGDETIVDAQFMTCYDEYNPLYEKETITIKETSKLPVTYDSMALIVIFAVIIVAIIIVLIVRNRLNKKEENK